MSVGTETETPSYVRGVVAAIRYTVWRLEDGCKLDSDTFNLVRQGH